MQPKNKRIKRNAGKIEIKMEKKEKNIAKKKKRTTVCKEMILLHHKCKQF